MKLLPTLIIVATALPTLAAQKPAPAAAAQVDCITCHRTQTPGIVADWEASAHSKSDPAIGCAACHGDQHRAADDVSKVKTVTAETCKSCHANRYDEFASSKHAFAWASMKAMPTTHWKPMEMIDGMKGCGACHKIGFKAPEEIARLKSEGSGFGFASCDACHTRHTFSVKEAREPKACATCHLGFDHPQWEMYSTSKHGVRHGLKRDGRRVTCPRDTTASTRPGASSRCAPTGSRPTRANPSSGGRTA